MLILIPIDTNTAATWFWMVVATCKH